MSIADELRKRVTEANKEAPAIQAAFEVVVKSMEEAADNSKRSCMLIPLGAMVNDEQFDAVISKLQAEGIEIVECDGGPALTDRDWTELKW